MNEVVVGANWQPRNNLSAHVSWHRFWLRNPAHAWYGAGGAPNRGRLGAFRDPAEMSGTNVGQEVDLDFVWSSSANTAFSPGVALFDPGSFTTRMNGGSSARHGWGYVAFLGRF